MQANLDASLGLVFSQPVLLALVQNGATRDEAYRIVQENAMRAWDENRPFRTLLEQDPRVAVGADVLDRAFDVARSLRHVDRTFAALDGL
jgi:adenylosuccinate lyase